MLKLAFAVFLSLGLAVNAYVDGGLGDLKETRVCVHGHVSTYVAHVSFNANDKSTTNTGEVHQKTISGQSDVNFEVSAVSPDSNECKLHITSACSVASEEGKQCDTNGTLSHHSTYFKEAADGETLEIHTMAEESSEATALKIAIINVLSQKVVASGEADIEFTGHDIDGPYKAKQRMVKNGPTVTLISTHVHSDTVEDDHESPATSVADGLATKHSATKAEIDTHTGQCSKISKKADINSGTDEDVSSSAIEKEQDPVGSPGMGELKIDGEISITRTGVHAVKPEEMQPEMEMLLQLKAGGRLVKHDPRARLVLPYSRSQVNAHIEDARAAMARPDFDVSMLRRSLNDQTAVAIIGAALGMTQAGAMPEANLLTTLGACQRIRSHDAQMALLDVLVDGNLPFNVREAALVSLSHADYERRPAAALVDGLARFAFAQKDSVLAARAVMVLGNAVRGHPDSALAAKHLSAIAHELKTAAPRRAMHLLGALANAGPSAKGLSAVVAPFIVSANEGVRHQAILALEGMDASAESTAALEAAKAYDTAAAEYHKAHGTTDLEAEIDALLEETQKVGFSATIYSNSYRVSGTDTVNLSINGKIAASYADSKICLSGSGWFQTKVFSGGDKLTEGILAACKKSGEPASLTFTYKLLNVQLGVSTLWKQSASEEEALEVSRGAQSDFVLGSAETDLQVGEESTVQGACPVDGSNIKIKDWDKEFFRLSYTYYGLLIPIGLTAGLKGSVAINAVFAISTGCQYEGHNTYGLVAGAAPSAVVSVFAHAHVTIFPFRAALEGSVVLLSGTLPITGDISTKHAHGFIKGTLAALSGGLDAAFYMFECRGWFCSKGGYHKNLGRFNIVKWDGPSKTWTLYNSPTHRF